ncbi:MAG: agmatinase [Parasphingorhabdus sp.]|jgi:agmatinase
MTKMNAMFGGDGGRGFMGMPSANPGQVKGADIVVVGAPCTTPYVSVGPYCADAPDAIRSAFGWPGAMSHHDFDLDGPVLVNGMTAVDWGNLVCHDIDFSHNRNQLRDTVSSILAEDAVPFVLGGDDSTPIPVFSAYEGYGPICIVQLDAHIDWRDSVAGETMGLSSNMRRASEMPWVTDIVQVGARGIGSARPSDYSDATQWGVRFFPMQVVKQTGLESIIEAIPDKSRIVLNIDIDVMDPSVVPGVIGPAPGGFDYWQAVSLLKSVSERGSIVGVNLTELMPANDLGNRGALVAARLLTVIMGQISRNKTIGS